MGSGFLDFGVKGSSSLKKALPRSRHKNTVMCLKQVEVHLDSGGHGNRLSVLTAGAEFPAQDCFHSLFVKSHPERFGDADIGDMAFGVDIHNQNYRAVDLCAARFF